MGPGAAPDCWKQSRYYHSSALDYPWKANTKIGRIEGSQFPNGTTSPNKSYAFKVEGDRRPDARVINFPEQDYLIEIAFSNLHGINDIRWINEKLIFMRPWWGRIAATDIIYDIENETIVYSESVTDGYIAYQQYEDGCARMGGCKCIKKK